MQQLVGDAFAPVQGGRFHPRAGALVEALLRGGAAGAGQSSWGPAVYGVVGSEAAGRELARRMEGVVGDGSVEVVAFDNRGARVRAVMKLLVSVVDAGRGARGRRRRAPTSWTSRTRPRARWARRRRR